MITAALSLRNTHSTNISETACHQLYVEYPGLVALPNSTIYEKESIGEFFKVLYWSYSSAAFV